MFKILYSLLFLFLTIFFVPLTLAKSNNFVSIVNPVRGIEFWDLKNQQPVTAVRGEVEILKQFDITATWLIRFDALSDKKITEILNNLPNDEKGIFLEITPNLAKEANVVYRQSNNWHSAGSAFLTGYERDEREKLIDVSFEKFKKVFAIYPTSVGAWWIDSYSLQYMQKKYGITAGLIVADQYTTDNYQIWGQYWSTPYYPSNKDALNPAQTVETKLPVVMMQWAARDPVNGYGSGVFESTYSVQANDYTDFHELSTKYFSSLVDLYTKQEFNQFNQIIVGLENSYEWEKYKQEYKNQIENLASKRKNNQFEILTMKDFSNWYKTTFTSLSQPQIIVSNDLLNSDKKTVWFMNPYYRAGLFINKEGVSFKDIRQYVEGEEEICYKKACSEVNFATFATRVLDEVTYGKRWNIDEGKISDFKVLKENEKYKVTYINEAGKQRFIEFLPRDISDNGKILSIDAAILSATKDVNKKVEVKEKLTSPIKLNFLSIFSETIKFSAFLLFGCIFPGFLFVRKSFSNVPILLKIFLSTIIGMVLLTVIFYLFSLAHLKQLIFVYIFVTNLLLLRSKIDLTKFNFPKINNWLDIGLVIIILAGTIFQITPTFKSGLTYSYGMGFWGPNTHDGVWHISLINQLIKSVPPVNPIFDGSILKNYHFFYDLLVAVSNYLSTVPVVDLVFRFYPIIFSALLGLGSYYIFSNLFKERLDKVKIKVAAIIGLYFIYFAGSFGWIVEFLRERHIGGESAFWANQSISFNLNPPFAISLLIIIAIIYTLLSFTKSKNKTSIFLIILLAGTLIGFKSYGAILVLISLLVISIFKFKSREYLYLLIFVVSLVISFLIFISNFQTGVGLILFSPFWFIHSMIDSPDRVGWVRVSLARVAGLENNQWYKFILAESLSFVIFIGGNLGLRIIGLFSLIKSKLLFKDTVLLFIAIFSLSSAIIPVLFIQSGNPWNTIQFFYYFLYTSSIFTGLVISSIIFRLPKFISLFVIPLILIFAPINSAVTANSYLGLTPHAKISNKELEALRFLEKSEDGVVLTYPYNKNLKSLPEPWSLFVYDSTAYVSAFSKKSVFIEDEPQNQILLTDYKKRLILSKDFFSNPKEDIKFLSDNDIKYIYLQSIFDIKIEDSTNIKKIFDNEEISIYKVNK